MGERRYRPLDRQHLAMLVATKLLHPSWADLITAPPPRLEDRPKRQDGTRKKSWQGYLESTTTTARTAPTG